MKPELQPEKSHLKEETFTSPHVPDTFRCERL